MIRLPTIMGTSSLVVRNLRNQGHSLSNGPCIQCVRWKRKPIWMPTAKSKMFRVPERPVLSAEETIKIRHLYNNYKTYMKSLRHYFIMKEKENKEIRDVGKQTESIEKDFLICAQKNEEWNNEIAAAREQRVLKERIERINAIQTKVEAKQERDRKFKIKVNASIEEVKKQVETFITHENIDKAIDLALNSFTNRNAALTPTGAYFTDQNYTNQTETPKEAAMHISTLTSLS